MSGERRAGKCNGGPTVVTTGVHEQHIKSCSLVLLAGQASELNSEMSPFRDLTSSKPQRPPSSGSYRKSTKHTNQPTQRTCQDASPE